MSVELIAIAQVTASSSGISFECNCGFKTATRNSEGNYVLELKDGHRTKHLVVQATRNNQVNGFIGASLQDRDDIQILSFDEDGVAADSSFFVNVWHVDD